MSLMNRSGKPVGCVKSIIGVSLYLPSDKHWMNFVYCLWESIVSDGSRKIRGKPCNDTTK